MTAGQRSELIVFERATVTQNEFNEGEASWTTLFSRRARVRFGSAQEQRQAAQETGVQTATFECVRSAELDGVTLKDRIFYLSSRWDLKEIAPLDRKTMRFTGTRTL